MEKRKLKTENQKRIEAVINNATEQIKMIEHSVKGDLMKVIETMSMLTGKTQIESFRELQEYFGFKARLHSGIRKRKVGRPRKKITKEETPNGIE
jgi:AAA+ superfamily predicted ATPase